MPGYTPFSCERQNRLGGGVLMYVKASLHPIQVHKEIIDNLDITIIQVKNSSRKLNLALIYRPPGQSADADDKLYEVISDISCHSDAIFFGDFNLPVTMWGAPLNAHSGRELYNNLQVSALYQHVNKPTRGANILDIILSTSDSLVNNVDVGSEFSTSYHRLITFDIKITGDKASSDTEKVPDFRRADFNKLKTLIANSNWNDITSAPV